MKNVDKRINKYIIYDYIAYSFNDDTHIDLILNNMSYLV